MCLLGKDDDGDTALMLASLYGHESIVKALLAAGAEIEGN
jgi:ankyrin repeat protein